MRTESRSFFFRKMCLVNHPFRLDSQRFPSYSIHHTRVLTLAVTPAHPKRILDLFDTAPAIAGGQSLSHEDTADEGDIAPRPQRPHEDTWVYLWVCPHENSTRRRNLRRKGALECATFFFLCGWWEYICCVGGRFQMKKARSSQPKKEKGRCAI